MRLNAISQSNCSELKSNDVVRVMKETHFKYINDNKGKDKALMKYFLSVNDESSIWQQFCVHAWIDCRNKSDNFYQIWLLDYQKISKEYWNKNCYALIFLLKSDNRFLGTK